MASSATGFNEGSTPVARYGRIGTARGSAIKVYYKFDGDLTDSSGNGLTLSVDNGTVRYCMISNLQLLACKGGLKLDLSLADSATLVITGAMTVHVFICPEVVTSDSSTDVICAVAASGESAATNVTSQLLIASYSPGWRTESGSGTDNDMNLTTYSFIQGVPILVTVTRDSSGEVQFYVDGKAVGSRFTEASPADGSSGTFVVGGWISGTGNDYTGAIAELQYLDVELTAAQVLEDAKKVMPWL